MYCENACLGVDYAVEDLKVTNEKLNAMVIAQVTGSQELVMMNSFVRESNEYLYKKCLQERISEIASWRWVLSDLSKRLEESIGALKYEHNALRVVVQRVGYEINTHSEDNSQPGAMIPLCDQVEDTILAELKFLREQKKKFEKIIPDLDKQTKLLEKTNKRIVEDILHKEQAIAVEETGASENDDTKLKDWKKKRKKSLPMNRWEKRCAALKRAGLRALANAIITRQQVRGARVQLSIAAQSYAARVDSALRRRLNANRVKLQDLVWQREEVKFSLHNLANDDMTIENNAAITDYKSLGEELTATEQGILETIDQERLVESRLANRTLRPRKELIKDDVDRKLRDELVHIKQFSKELRNNMARLTSLQNHLSSAISRIDCCAEDLIQVIRLDEDRIRSRMGQDDDNRNKTTPPERHPTPRQHDHLEVIQEVEEEEEDDYPFDI